MSEPRRCVCGNQRSEDNDSCDACQFPPPRNVDAEKDADLARLRAENERLKRIEAAAKMMDTIDSPSCFCGECESKRALRAALAPAASSEKKETP